MQKQIQFVERQKPMITKSAVLIGLNYPDTNSQLFGCHNDVYALRGLLTKHGYTKFTVLTDEPSDVATSTQSPKATSGRSACSKSNILAALTAAIMGAKAGDTVFVAYSGHGGNTADVGRTDERDGRDETLVVYNDAGDGFEEILDDTLRSIFALANPAANIICIFDSCHSGTVMDLPYRFAWDARKPTAVTEASTLKNKNIMCISGCRDQQTSADATFGGGAAPVYNGGALTTTFVSVVSTIVSFGQESVTWRQVIEQIGAMLAGGGFDQVPQLTFSGQKKHKSKFAL